MLRKTVLLALVFTLLLSGILVVTMESAAKLFYADVALIYDEDVFGLSHTEDILSSMELSCDLKSDNRYFLYTADLDLLLRYPRVIFYNSNRSITSDEHSALESYLAEGGNLLVTGLNSLGDPTDQLLADIVRSKTTGNNDDEPDLYVRDPTHPIMNGSYGSFPAGYHIGGLESDNDRAEADTRRGAVTVAELADWYDKIIATQTAGGKVVYWNGIGVHDWSYGNASCTVMFKNAIVWLYPGHEHDLVVSLKAPYDFQVGWSTVINATVYNRGLNNETNVKVQLLINGSVVKSETIPLLESGASYIIGYFWEPVEGVYNVTAYTPPFTGEQMTVNNNSTKVVPVLFYFTNVYLEPEYLLIGAFPCSFDVTIKISNVTDLYGYAVHTLYNSNVLNFTKATFRPDFIFNYTENIMTWKKVYEGEVIIVSSLMGGQEPRFSGSGILCHLEFTAIQAGRSPLRFSKVDLSGLDGMATPIGTLFPQLPGSIDVKLMANSHIVTIEPLCQVESWNFTSMPKEMDFNFTVLEGISHCNMSIPQEVMDGPFEIIIDNNWTDKIGYVIEFNATHVFLHFNCGHIDGVHNVKVIEGIPTVQLIEFPDVNGDGKIDLYDVVIVCIHYGE